MQPAIAYDITRLVTRVLNLTPNGIDRIDFALARHFLARADSAGMMATGLGPRVLSGDKARAAVEAIGAHWGEEAAPGEDPGYLRVPRRASRKGAGGGKRATARIAQGGSGRVLGALHAVRLHQTRAGETTIIDGKT